MDVEDDISDDDEDAQITDVVKDRYIAMVLEAIFQEKEKNVRIVEVNLKKISDCYNLLGTNEVVLKACFLSYILYMKIGSESNPDLNEYSKKIDSLL